MARKSGESDLQMLPLEEVDIDPFFSRREISQLEGLAEDIRSKGVLQPGIVWRQGDRFILVAGRRRYEALRRLARDEPDKDWRFPCRILNAPDRRSAMAVSLSENLQRCDLTAMDVSVCLWRLVEEEGFSTPDGAPDTGALAAFCRRSPAWIHTHLALRNLTDTVKQKVASGEMSGSAAMRIASLSEPEQERIIEHARKTAGALTRDAVVRSQREVGAAAHARTARQMRVYFESTLSTEDPKLAAGAGALEWRLTTAIREHAQLMLKFISGEITDSQMDSRVARMFKTILQDASKGALKRWEKQET